MGTSKHMKGVDLTMWVFTHSHYHQFYGGFFFSLSLSFSRSLHVCNLGVVLSWTMKLSLAPSKYVIGCWTLPNTTSIHIKKHKKTWGPLKAYFQSYIIHCHGPTCFVVRKANEVLLLQMSKDQGREMSFYLFTYFRTLLSLQGRMEEEGE